MKPLTHLPTRADFLAASDATRTIEVLRKKAGLYAEAVARMVLEEMMEPTIDMLEAANTSHMSREDALDVWHAMIKCALRDRRPEAPAR